MLSDLAMIRSLRLLERIQVGALLDELKLGQSGRADPSTAARVGRLLRAERMVQASPRLRRTAPSACRRRWCAAMRGACGRAGERHIQAAARSREAARVRSHDRAWNSAHGSRAATHHAAGSQKTWRRSWHTVRDWTRWMAAIIERRPARSPPRLVLIRPSRRLGSISRRPEAAPAVQASPGDVVTVVEAVSRIKVPPQPASVGALHRSPRTSLRRSPM